MDKIEYVGRKRIPVIRQVLYEKWPAGEFGRLGATNAMPGSFESSNMVIYRDGFFGPRKGFKEFTDNANEVNGAIKGILWRGTPGAALAYIQGTAVWSIDGGVATLWAGALAVTPTEPTQFVEYGSVFTYVTNFGDKTYKFDHSLKTCTAVAASPGGRDIAFYGDRLAVIGQSGNLYRVLISAANAPDNWAGGEFFDVPNQSGALMAGIVQRNHLSLWAQNGEWWIVTGALGTSAAFLRRVSGGGQHPWFATAQAAEVLPDDDILHIPVDIDVPAKFNGATVSRIEHLNFNGGVRASSFGSVKVLRGVAPSDGVVVFPLTGNMALHYNEMWTYHKTALPISEFCATDEQGVVFLTDGGSAGTKPRFFKWQIEAGQPARPGLTTDVNAQPGDASTTHNLNAFLNMPEYWIREGFEVRIRRVIIDFKEFDCGATSPNGFTVTPRSISRYKDPDSAGYPGYKDGTPISYSATPAAWTTGVGSERRRRIVMLFGTNNAYGGAFQLRVSGIGGVAFSAFHVDGEVRFETPRE